MDLYIDKENLRSFLNSRDKDEFDDCLRMLRRQLHIVYNMDKADVKNDAELLPWNIQIVTNKILLKKKMPVFR